MLVVVSGARSFERFARGCHNAARETFDREMDRGLQEVGDDIVAAVRAATDIYMPSGYEDIFRTTLQSTVQVQRGIRRGVTIVMYGRGSRGRREVERLDDGHLRHPIWGRYRVLSAGGRYAKKRKNIVGGRYKNPWHAQKIRSGFFSDPVRKVGPHATQRRLDNAIGRVFHGIETTI